MPLSPAPSMLLRPTAAPAALVALLATGLGGPVWAQEPAGAAAVEAETPGSAHDREAPDLVVRVLDGGREDRGVTRAQVTLFRTGPESQGEGRVAGRLTGGDGRVSFADLPEGTYRLAVEAPGFETLESQVRLPTAETIHVVLQPRPLTLEEVVGTASPLRSGVTYTAVQAFDRDALTERMGASIGSMLDGEPGVAMRSLGAAATRPVIRGFDGDRILVLENGERMGDVGETAADHAVALDPLTIERLEVVRGPASLLYGSGALGGVVNLTTRDMPRTWSRGWEGALETQASSMNSSASASGILLHGADHWATTFRFSAREAGDIRTPAGRIRDTALSSRDGSVGLVRQWDELHLGVSGSFVDREYGVPEEWDDPDEEVFIAMERQSLQARLDWEPVEPGFIRGLEWRTLASRFFQQEVERGLQEDGRVDEDVELEYDALSFSSTATLRHGPVGVFAEGAFGMAVRGRRLDIGGDEAFTPGVDERSVGMFTFQEAPLSDDLTLQVGARIEGNWNGARPNDDFPDSDDTRNATAFSGSVGLNWRPGAGWETGLQVARAHRVPLVEELFAHGPHIGISTFEIGDPDLADEVSHGLDLFVRRDFARGSVEMAGFANWINDYVAFQPLGRIDQESGFPVFQYQGTDARLLGGELSGDVRLNEVWSAGAGVDWVRGARTDSAGDPLPSIPPLRTRVQLRADPGRWWAGATLRATSSQDRVAPDEPATDGYLLLDVRAGLRMDPMGSHSVLLRVDNALNQSYRDHLSRLPSRDLLMPGRAISVSYRWRF